MTERGDSAARADDWPVGGGEMGERTRAFDWARTSVGPMDAWPRSLKTAVFIMLTTQYPMLIWWGDELIHFYNDAYMPVLGKRHPDALGRPAPEVWSEAWPLVGPQADAVMSSGRSYWNEELLIVMTRNGYPEEVYMTFSYGPILGDDGSVGGVFCACTEETQRVLGRRRLGTLQALADRASEAKTVEEACEIAASTLGENPHDLPFVLLYLLDADGQRLALAGAVGLAPGAAASPTHLALGDPDLPWPFVEAVEMGQEIEVGLRHDVDALPGGPWPEPAQQAVVLPMARPGQAQVAGFVVAGVSPRRPLDEPYRGFLTLVAGQVATAVANARAYEEERKRAEALAELDRAKTAFFSNVSHEFRTPLTLMLGPLEEVLADGLPPDQRERLEVAHRSALRLLKLVNTLLDFSRIEAGRIQAVYEPTDLAALTAELASVFRSAIERAGLRLVVDSPPIGEPVYVDREMWEKIVLNLLSNAFKFTFEGEITVRLRRDGEHAVLTVRDTGTGIPPDEQARIFERFHRVQGAQGRSFEGTGIGLSLVQELVRLHGGTVRVESEVGRGSAFVVSVPLGTAHLPADRVGAARALASTALRGEAYVEEALRWLPDDLPPSPMPESDLGAAPAPEPRWPAAEDQGGPVACILLADDNADLRDYVGRLLAGRYEVVAVPDGAAALEVARSGHVDLVLADVMMPVMDGFALLAALRADDRTRTLPIIMLSARAGEESRVEGMEAGADDYLVKPFAARELLARVRAHLDIARVRLEAEAVLRVERRVEAEERARAEAALRVTEERQAFLLRLSDEISPLTTPGEIVQAVGARIGAHLRLSTCVFADVDERRQEVVVHQGWSSEGDPVAVQTFHMADYLAEACQRAGRAGEPTIVANAATDPRAGGAACAGSKVGAFALIPFHRGGRWSHFLAVSDAAPREWRADEIVLLQEISERVFPALERAGAEEALRVSEAALAADLADTSRLQEVSSRLARDGGADDLYETLVDAAIALMRADAGSMKRLDAEQQKLRLLAWRGLAPESAAYWSLVSTGSRSSCGIALERGARAIVADVETCDDLAGTDDLAEYRRSGLRASQTTPLIARDGRLVGMISTHWRAPHEPAERELRLFDVLVRQAADLVERHESERILRASEEQHRSLFESIDEGFCTIEMIFDEAGRPTDYRFLTVNPSFVRQTGLEDAVGRRMRELRPLHEHAWFEIYGHVAMTGEAVRFEQRADQLGRYYDVYAFRIGRPEERRLGILFNDVAERKRLEAERERLVVAEAVAAERQALLKRVVRAQEEERRRLSHEVHDSVTQLVHAASLRLDDLADRLATVLTAEDLRDLERARDLARSAAGEARRLIAGLRPETLDQFGLVGALRAELESLRREGWRARFVDRGMTDVRIDAETESILYRVAQEALANVRKHAGPTNVEVRLRRDDGHVRLTVQDRGRGFDPSARRSGADLSRQLGLVGMRERVELLGGSFALSSAPGKGTRIDVVVPIAPPDDASIGNG